MADFTGQPESPWSWVPQEWLTPEPAIPDVPPPVDPLALAEYSLPGGIVQPVPPPPPPPPVRRFGGQPAIEETSGPVPAAAPTSGEAAPGQPGSVFGIPPGIIDALPIDATPTSSTPDEVDPWAVPSTPTDPWGPGPDAAPIGDALRELHPVGQAVAFETATPEQLGESYAELARQDPVAYAGLRASKIAERDAFTSNQRAKALVDDTALMEANLRARAEAKKKADALAAQVDQEAKQLSPDGGWMSSRSPLQKIAAYLTVAIGGLVQGRAGGPNLGLQMINTDIDRYIAAQKTKLADKRNAVTQMYDRLGSEYAGNEAIRAATWKQVEARLETERGNYDPRGARAMMIADEIQKARVQQAEALQRVHTAEQKRQIDLAKFDLDRQKQALDVQRAAEQVRSNKAGEGIAWAGRANERERLKFDKDKHKDDQLLERDKLNAKRNEELAKQDRELGVGGVLSSDESGNPVFGKLTQGDGKTAFHAPDQKTHGEILKSRSGLLNLLDASSKLKSLRAKAGGANRFSSPSDQLEFDRLTKRAVFDYAAANNLSTSDEASMNAIRDRLFGGDPSGYNVGDVIGRIDRSMDESKTSYFNQLRGAGYTGSEKQAVQFVDSSKFDDAPLSADEQDFKDLFIHPSEAKGEERARLGLGGATGEGGPNIAPAQQHTLEALRQQALRDPNAPDEKGEKPSTALVAQRTKERDTALERLRRVADEAPRQQSHGGPFGLVPDGGEFGIGVEARKILNSIISSGLDLDDPRATQQGSKDALDPRAVR